MENLFWIYKITGYYISFIPLLIGLYGIRKLDRAFLFLLVMILCETGIAVYSRWQQINGTNNIPSLHLMTFLEILFGSVFFLLILEKLILKKTLLILSFSLLLYTTLNSLFFQSIYVYNQIPRTLEGSLFVLYSFFFFYELLKQTDLIELSKSAKFWAVIAFFTYFGTTQFVHLFSEHTMIHHLSFHRALRELNRTMIILYYSIFAIALFMNQKRNKSLNHFQDSSFNSIE